MTPVPALISRVLALPLEARRALAEQPGAGWWAWMLYGHNVRSDRPVRQEIEETPTTNDSGHWTVNVALDSGWAWLPSDPLAWMVAATAGTGEWWSVSPAGAVIVRGGPTGDVLAEDPDPRVCALDYLEARR